jgi:hypothetical protein
MQLDDTMTALGNANDAISHSSRRNSSTDKPASRTIPHIVNAPTGLFLGMVKKRLPSVITMCFPWRKTRNPAFSSALTAARWLTPGILAMFLSSDLDFGKFNALENLVNGLKIFRNGDLDILDRFFPGRAL